MIVEDRGVKVKSNKGQALLEFVLILPILLLFIMAIIDLGTIIYEKNRLENIANDAVDLVSNNDLSDDQIEKKLRQNYKIPLNLTVDRKKVNVIIKLNKEVDVITPGLGIAIPDPYIVETSRVINNE